MCGCSDEDVPAADGGEMMNLNEYLLVKAFECAEYRDQFNKGDIYLKSVSYYWNSENAFQQDKEGSIFQQEGRGYLIRANDDFKAILDKSSSLDDIIRHMDSEKAGEIISETKDFFIRLDGYLCCFYLLPKSVVSFTSNTLSIRSEHERNNLAEFLNRYGSESRTHDFYVSIYDAFTLCNVFIKGMSDKGYNAAYSQVSYKDIDMATKIALFQKGDYNSIIFTKPTKYSYQKEFRFFISKPNEPIKEHITVGSIDIEKSRFGSFDYANLVSLRK